MSTSEAARRLGVKVETLYAYVSRGVLTSHHDPRTRTSRFDTTEVERLARRGRPRRSTRPPALDLTIETHLTQIDDHRVRYRGVDAAVLARTCTFEAVAELLWTGALPASAPRWTPADRPDLPDSLRRSSDRLRAAVVLAGADDPSGGDLRPEAVVATARRLVRGLVGAVGVRPPRRIPTLTVGGPATRVSGSVAGDLWARLAPSPSAGRRAVDGARLLNTALVLLADHELAASTLAARVAASTRADPYAVVLLDDLRSASRGDRRVAVVDDVIAAVRRRRGIEPNVDLALAALSSVFDLPADAGEVVFTVARSAGWIAHALEEYQERPVRFRPRGVYVGVTRPAG